MKQNTLWKIFGVAFLVALTGVVNGANGDANNNNNPEKYQTSCDPIQIYLSQEVQGKPRGFGYVQLYTERAIEAASTFDNVSVTSQPDAPLAQHYDVDGFTAQILQTQLLDTSVDVEDGGLGKTQYTRKTFAAKIHLSANEPIELGSHGDIGFDVKMVDKWAICHETGYHWVQ